MISVMKNYTFYTWTCVLICVLGCSSLNAQDAFFTTFYNKKSFYNPAAVGLENSLSLRASAKSQWKSPSLPAYQSAVIAFEDALPCSRFDWGGNVLVDREGEGKFSTYQAGLKFSYSLAEVGGSLFNQHNIRFGFDMSFGKHTIDFSKLTFSDQIDPKYGFIYDTSFVPPTNGSSPLFFNPGGGIIWQSRWNRKSAQSIITNFGASLSNSYAITGDNSGHTSSLLGLPNRNRQVRCSAFAEMNLIPYYQKGFFLNISPLLFFQSQGGIHYWEIGTAIEVSGMVEIGVYTHNTNLIADDGSSNWLSFTGKLNLRTSDQSRLVLDFTYSTNYKGLQNQVGAIFEVGITYHLARSFGCELIGRGDEVLYSDKPHCPIMSISPGKRKMYENVWYRN